MQDTLRQKIPTANDTSASLHLTSSSPADPSGSKTKVIYRPVLKASAPDTVSACHKNIYTEVSGQDSTFSVHSICIGVPDAFPLYFIDKNKDIFSAKRELLSRSLKEGELKPPETFRSDWIVPLLFFSALLIGIVRSVPGNFFRNMFRSLTMRGINENASRDTGSLFQWQSTLLNLSAFISVSFFCFLILRYYNVTLPGISRFLQWLICFGFIIAAVTLRHLICNITGSLSDENEIFREYIVTIYHAYRFGGILLLILSSLILYVPAVPVKFLFISGIFAAGILYLLRVVRLLLIFLTRHVSILYLILYLCALEILPVVILVKYVTGLV
ncbi:MAG TPA: DUF4271 domain-containing protein [Bacteroidales bacterium]|nr:DUF4271 domain-containing protein [Bacteroidales bacterium]